MSNMVKRQRGFGFFHILMIVIVGAIAAIAWNSHQKELAKQAAIEQRAAEVRQGEADLARLKSLAEEWDAAKQVAAVTSRVALAQPVGRLQDIRRKVKDAQFGKCVSPARDALVQYMQTVINLFLAFMEDSSASSAVFAQEASEKKDEFNKALMLCKVSLEPLPGGAQRK